MATFSGKVTGGSLAFRSTPGGTAISGKSPIDDNTPLTVSTISGNTEWFSTTYSGTSGYVMSRWIAITSGGVKTGTVTTASGSLNVRATPSANGTVSFTVAKDSTVQILEGPTSGFYRIGCSQGTGWASETYITVSGGSSGGGTHLGTGTVIGGGPLYCRKQPIAGYEYWGQFAEGTTVQIYSCSTSGWYETRWPATGTNVGYVMTQYIQMSGGGTTPTGTLREGDSGQDVRDLQTRLNALLYDCGTVDGQFGRRTTWAVKYFQFKNSLTVDGIAGTNTLTKLNSASPVKGISSTIENWSANQEPQFYAQTDTLWNKYPYDATGTSTTEYIGDAGCGPTSMAMVVSTLAKKAVLPPVLGDWALANNYRDPAGIDGTRFSFFAACAANYGLTATTYTAKTTANLQSVRTHCNNGGLAVVNVFSASPYTSAGHYVVIYKIDSSDKIYVKNPNPSTGESVGTISQWVNGGWFGGIACIKR